VAATNPYTTADLIRDVDEVIDQEWPSDGGDNDDYLEEFCENWINPVIDMRLQHAGYETPLTTIPAIIKTIAADLTAARILSGRIAGFTSSKPKKAEQLEESAMKELEFIKKTQPNDVDGLTKASSGRAVDYDSTPEYTPDRSTYVGRDETRWREEATLRDSESSADEDD